MAEPKVIADLLLRAKAAHGEYERTELGGVYDEQWARWYAQFIVDNGLADVLGRQISPEEMTTLLRASWEEQQRSAPDETWERFTATRISMLAEGPG